MPIIDSILSITPDTGKAKAFKGSIRAYFAIKREYPSNTLPEARKALISHSEAIEQHFNISIAEMDEYIQEFWQRGLIEDSPLQNALAIIEADGVDEFNPELMLSPPMEKLATLCRMLSEQSEKGVFFIPVRKVGEVLSISHSGAALMIRRLIEKGLIVKHGEHKRGSQKAQRFKWTDNTEYPENKEY